MTKTRNPLYIAIPKHANQARDYWDIVRSCNGSRRKMVDFICGIGGYSDRSDRFAIEFNIKTYGSDLTEKGLWELLTSDQIDVGPQADLSPAHLTQVKALFSRVFKENEESLWSWGVEEAYESWKDSDTPYETFEGRRVDWSHEVHGRSGGHLCMTECEGIDLRVSDDDLRDNLLYRDRNHDGSFGEYDISHKAVVALFIICVQNSVDLKRAKIDAEVQYRAAWRLWVSFIEDQVPAILGAYDKRQQLAETGDLIIQYLSGRLVVPDEGIPSADIDAFRTICTLADINLSE